MVRPHADDLTLDAILATLTADLAERGAIDSPVDHGLSDADLGKLLIDTYVQFPAPALSPSPADA